MSKLPRNVKPQRLIKFLQKIITQAKLSEEDINQL